MSKARFDLGGGAEMRPYEMTDLETVFALVDAERDRLRRWLPWVDVVRTIDDERRWLEGILAVEEAAEDGFGIWDAGAFAGGIGIHIDRLNDQGDIGYWLGGVFEGRGLVTRACRTLISYGFERGLHRISIRAAPGNTRSRAVPERLGFVQEGILREAGKTGRGYVDLVVYGLLADEWKP